VMPGFVILGCAQNLLLGTPTDDSLLLWTIYAFKVTQKVLDLGLKKV
jgi:hypothetical protein